MNRDLLILLNKLISYRAGKTRYLGAMLALTLSIILLLLAVQIQTNFNQLLKSENTQDSIADFLVINRELTDANIGNTSLPDTLIEDIKKQPFTTAIGFLEASRFKASIESNSPRFPFYTDISFESTPTDFIDIDAKDWHWKEGDNIIPVIVPTQFLDIYNFQFSISQNLPQLTPAVVKMIVFKITIYGNNSQASFNGRVVGFSDRISSMLVPSSFMKWANERYASSVSTNPSRVIMKTKDPSDPSLTKYLQAKGLKTDTEKTRFSKYRRIVHIAVWILGGSGFIMLGFAILIFTLFIQLTVASCKPEIILLTSLGCSPNQLYQFLMKRFFFPGIQLLLLGIFITALFQYTGSLLLEKQQIKLSPFLSIYTIITAGLLLLLLWLANNNSIKNTIAKQSNG